MVVKAETVPMCRGIFSEKGEGTNAGKRLLSAASNITTNPASGHSLEFSLERITDSQAY